MQAEIERSLAQVAAQPVSVVCAGRTDASVHARARSRTPIRSAIRAPRAWTLGANSHLPADVSLSWTRAVPRHFHARYSAERVPIAISLCAIAALASALAAGRATLVHRPLDEARMSEAARHLEGEHDFSAFRAAECQARSPIRRLEELTVTRHADWLVIRACANAFLHHMVRNIAGLLIAVGQVGGARVAAEVLASRDRTQGAPTAPPSGLYLWSVRYPRAFGLPDGEPASAWDMIARLPRGG